LAVRLLTDHSGALAPADGRPGPVDDLGDDWRLGVSRLIVGSVLRP
jgi:hypothetical protein